MTRSHSGGDACCSAWDLCSTFLTGALQLPDFFHLVLSPNDCRCQEALSLLPGDPGVCGGECETSARASAFAQWVPRLPQQHAGCSRVWNSFLLGTELSLALPDDSDEPGGAEVTIASTDSALQEGSLLGRVCVLLFVPAVSAGSRHSILPGFSDWKGLLSVPHKPPRDRLKRKSHHATLNGSSADSEQQLELGPWSAGPLATGLSLSLLSFFLFSFQVGHAGLVASPPLCLSLRPFCSRCLECPPAAPLPFLPSLLRGHWETAPPPCPSLASLPGRTYQGT